MKQSKNYLLLALFVCLSFSVFGQNEAKGLVRQVNLSIIHPGISAELPVSNKFSIIGKTGIRVNFNIYEIGNVITDYDYSLFPTYNVQGRYYYQGVKRDTYKGKELLGNSGDYLFLQFGGNLDVLASSVQFTESVAGYNTGLGLGLQRIYGNKLIVSLGFGAGYSIASGFGTIGEFTLGFNLFTR